MSGQEQAKGWCFGFSWCNRDRIVFSTLITIYVMGYLVRNEIANYLSQPEPFTPRVTGLDLMSSKFWDSKDAYHGYGKSPLLDREQVCNGFFAMWPSDCTEKNDDLHEKLHVMSAQMEAMNATLTLYVTGLAGCDFPYPGIEVNAFNTSDLLEEMGFAPAMNIIDTWDKTRHTRISDILRIGMAYKTGKSYADTDIAYLSLNKDYFQRSYVGAALWSNAKNAIEITNGAFCLPKPVLSDMMAFQKNRVLKGGDKYFYTELGPSMFHNVLMNRHDVVMYSQNAPAQSNLDAIARDIHQYGHRQLHLTGHVRKGNAHLNFGELVNAIRLKSGFTALNYPKLQATSSDVM
jgi:hypothetical protein